MEIDFLEAIIYVAFTLKFLSVIAFESFSALPKCEENVHPSNLRLAYANKKFTKSSAR